jgi:caffeoyl-CoA O-methyltransferase
MDEALREKMNTYITDLFGREDDALKHIQAETERNGMPDISLEPFEGRLLQFLAEMVGAKKIVEIGTLAGYSGTWLARALPADGKLITVEVSSKHANVARANFENAGLSSKVEVRQGDAHDILNKLSSQAPFDMVFIDADKDSYPFYLDWAIANLRVGGLIAAHNALRGGAVVAPESESDKGMIAFNQSIAEHPQLSSYLIGVGDGMALAIRKS